MESLSSANDRLVFEPLRPELIDCYAVSGPRYTSYPTAVEFGAGVDSGVWSDLVRRDAAAMTGSARGALYFHIPFCRNSCHFCACNKVVSNDSSLVAPYLAAVKSELAKYQELLGGKGAPVIEQIHWGGGSPNFLTVDEIEQLHQATLAVFSRVHPEADISVELDPRWTTVEQVLAFRRCGFTRLSFGVQDFDIDVQRAVNRLQSVEQTKELFAAARQQGYSGINVDLIYGLPKQTPESFLVTVNRVIELRADRVALYGYAHVTWLRTAQQLLERHHLPSPAERMAIFLAAGKRFADAGYEYVGLDHFALSGDELSRARREGRLCRNFMGYTTHHGARVYGFGASSISMNTGGFAQNVKDVSEYQQRAAHSGLAVERGLRRSVEDRMRWDVIEKIMCHGLVKFAEWEQVWGREFGEHFAGELRRLEPLAADGLVTLLAGKLELTPRGRLLARNVAMIFDAYLAAHREKKVFSQAV